MKRRDKYFLYLMDGSLIVTTILLLLLSLLLLLIRHVDCRHVGLYKRRVRAFFPLNPSGANRDLRLFSSFIDDIITIINIIITITINGVIK